MGRKPLGNEGIYRRVSPLAKQTLDENEKQFGQGYLSTLLEIMSGGGVCIAVSDSEYATIEDCILANMVREDQLRQQQAAIQEAKKAAEKAQEAAQKLAGKAQEAARRAEEKAQEAAQKAAELTAGQGGKSSDKPPVGDNPGSSMDGDTNSGSGNSGKRRRSKPKEGGPATGPDGTPGNA